MRKIAALLLILGVAACGDDAQDTNDNGTEDRVDWIANGDAGSMEHANFIRITVDGMPCILYKDRTGHGTADVAYSGLTCDWSQSKEAPGGRG